MKKETHYFYKYHFKQAAIRVANHPEIQTKDVAEALNIHPFMLSRWKKQMREGVLRKDNNKSPKPISPNELRDAKKLISELKQKNKRLLQENQVLRKAERLFPEKK